MSVHVPTLYSEAWAGEPLPRPVQRPVLNTARAIWSLLDYAIQIPLSIPARTPSYGQMVRDIKLWTSWSQRHLADVLDTTHTTLRRAEAGGALMEARSGDLRHRIEAAHAVIERVFLLADRDPVQTARLLEAAPATGAPTAVAALRAGDPDRAYLAALDVRRPRPAGLLVSSRPRQGGAIVPLHD